MTPPRKISMLIAEDHAVVCQGLRALLSADGGFTVLGEASTGHQAVAMAAELRPDVILMDIAMPELNGLESTLRIIEADPKAKILVLSAHSEEVYVDRMMEAGACGFLQKQTSAEILTKAVREVAAGRRFFSASINPRATRVPPGLLDRNGRVKPAARRLTSRELEVLQLVAEGAANKQVAAQLSISIKTVEKHRQHVMDKLGIHDTAGLTRYAIASGIVESSVVLTII